jgi:hypothetical protein
MTRRKREITGLANEQDFPHVVELAVPPEGFRGAFLEFDAFHRERRIPVRRGRSRRGGQASLYSILLPRQRHCGCIPQSLRWRVLDPRGYVVGCTGRLICLATGRIAASFSSLFPLSFHVFHSPIDGGDQFIVPLAFGPSLFRSQHVCELGQQVAFFLPNEHGLIFRLSLNSWTCAPSREAGVQGRRQKMVDRLSTKAKVEDGKSEESTRSAQPPPTS